MLYTLQIIVYSFITIFICHNLYLFYVDNFSEKTHHHIISPVMQGNNHKKIYIHDEISNKNEQHSNQESQSMKNELQQFLKSQIPTDKNAIIGSLHTKDDTQYVGTTNIEDIPISA